MGSKSATIQTIPEIPQEPMPLRRAFNEFFSGERKSVLGFPYTAEFSILIKPYELKLAFDTSRQNTLEEPPLPTPRPVGSYVT